MDVVGGRGGLLVPSQVQVTEVERTVDTTPYRRHIPTSHVPPPNTERDEDPDMSCLILSTSGVPPVPFRLTRKGLPPR